MTRVNDFSGGVRNGTKGWVERVDPAAGTLAMTTLDGKPVTLDHEYLDKGGAGGGFALQHGYAATIYKAQGKTADTNFALGDDSVFRDLAYSAAPRQATSPAPRATSPCRRTTTATAT